MRLLDLTVNTRLNERRSYGTLEAKIGAATGASSITVKHAVLAGQS